jgi:hypothetical protein
MLAAAIATSSTVALRWTVPESHQKRALTDSMSIDLVRSARARRWRALGSARPSSRRVSYR